MHAFEMWPFLLIVPQVADWGPDLTGEDGDHRHHTWITGGGPRISLVAINLES